MTIKPWIGPKWKSSDGRFGGGGFLVLGESSHAAEHEIGSSPTNLIVDNVRKFVDSKPNWRFYVILTTLLSGKDHIWEVTDEERKSIWESVAFTNYVTVVAGKYSREAPTRLQTQSPD